MRATWALRGLLLAIIVTLVARLVGASASPLLDHSEFELPKRQKAAAQALSDRGARFCCGEAGCDETAKALGRFATIVLCADARRVPQCGDREGLLLDGALVQSPLTLRALEKVVLDFDESA